MQLNELETHAADTWGPTAMVVLVVCDLHRIVGPLTQFLNEVIANVKLQGLLTLAEPGNFQVCIVDTLTGPASMISHIIRHRRQSSDADLRKGAKQTLSASRWP